MLLLPTEILRQIPTNYREWKLLQLASNELNERLGDYHEAQGIHAFTEGDTEIPYNVFARELVEQMSGEDTKNTKHLTLCCKCVWSTDNSQLRACDVLLEWDRDALIHYDNSGGYQFIIRPVENLVPGVVFIGDEAYLGASAHPQQLYQYVYDEVPRLWSSMLMVTRMKTPGPVGQT